MEIEKNGTNVTIMKLDFNKFIFIKNKDGMDAFNCGAITNLIPNSSIIEMRVKIIKSTYAQTMFGIMPQDKFRLDGKLSNYYFFNNNYDLKGIFYCPYDSTFYLNPTINTREKSKWENWSEGSEYVVRMDRKKKKIKFSKVSANVIEHEFDYPPEVDNWCFAFDIVHQKDQYQVEFICMDWSPENNKFFSRSFQRGIFSFCLCLKRLNSLKGIKLPKFIIYEIIKKIDIFT
eukprot:TRINITY_DN36_c1_g1_i2.p1 TRINITY_DN36_c1_g1~~TRINITY_DN36_c1_g1_i2.p1  ORF type:complete len:231 (-),score=42.44 TRINITY_DN36_c1_g1_i2:76-768(-)